MKSLREHYNLNYKVELFDDERDKTEYRYRLLASYADEVGTSQGVYSLNWFATEDDALDAFWTKRDEIDKLNKEFIELNNEEENK